MLFSSFTFLFVFLPLIFVFYFSIKNRKYRNIVLFIFSLLFYAWGEPVYILLMLFSITINYYMALKIEKNNKKLLIINIIFNLLVIVFFKYANFIISNINMIIGTNISKIPIGLPIGISFYTFQILSYIIDVYRKKIPAQKNIINLGMYITLFPQLIAGPIVRYETILNEIENRNETINYTVEGLKRFMIGLGKKVIIANQVALIADTIYNGDITTSGTAILWLAAISYTLQIYFDFSGYSDMAIGLGKVFGFHFLENFNYPYIAKSITDFWRRWHISLSSWFKDYVYIPLGGNRVNKIKWIRNIFIVWFFTGLWHGASWNFIVWGLYYGLLLMVEKLFLGKILDKAPNIIKHAYTLLFVIIGWVIFRIENFSQMIVILKNMFIWKNSNILFGIILNFEVFSALPFVIVGIIGSIPIIKNIKKRLKSKITYSILSSVCSYGVFLISICFLLSETYNPFIYFRF